MTNIRLSARKRVIPASYDDGTYFCATPTPEKRNSTPRKRRETPTLADRQAAHLLLALSQPILHPPLTNQGLPHHEKLGDGMPYPSGTRGGPLIKYQRITAMLGGTPINESCLHMDNMTDSVIPVNLNMKRISGEEEKKIHPE